MNYFSSKFKLGILGGGQLGKMLLYETRKWDIATHVLDPSGEAPCKIACNKFVVGDLLNFDTVYNFGKNLDLVTIEIENVNVAALRKLEDEGVKVYPPTPTPGIINKNATHKIFYKDKGITNA
jgi:5-(carboxyamino)imidazole ribonucleotide synthase